MSTETGEKFIITYADDDNDKAYDARINHLNGDVEYLTRFFFMSTCSTCWGSIGLS